MKIGSIVECIDGDFGVYDVPEVKFPEKGEIYTIRAIDECPCGCGVFIKVEEIINPIVIFNDGSRDEPLFCMENFREIEFNEDEIKEIIDETIPCTI